MTAIRYLVVDDSEVDSMMVEVLSNRYSNLIHVGSFTHPIEALEAIKTTEPHLIFLDIEMPGANGLELLRVVKDIVPMTVFITSFPDFALDGFELSALDYILKPLTEDRFAKTINKVFEYWDMKQKALAYDVLFEKERLVIKEGYNEIHLQFRDIIYLEAMHNYTKIVTDKKKYMTNINLSSFMDKLDAEKFLRVHRSFAVSRKRIREYRATELVCETEVIPIGKTYRSLIASIRA